MISRFLFLEISNALFYGDTSEVIKDDDNKIAIWEGVYSFIKLKRGENCKREKKNATEWTRN